MARKLFKRFMPDPELIKNHRSLQMLGAWVHDPNLWHLNRYSASLAFFIGLFAAFIPIPAQMLLAGLLATWWRANLPISVALVWLTNPVTMPPVFYANYKVGGFLLGRAPDADHVQTFRQWLGGMNDICGELGWLACVRPWSQWLLSGIEQLWTPFLAPFLVGSVVCGVVAGVLGASAVRILWRVQVTLRWRARARRHQPG